MDESNRRFLHLAPLWLGLGFALTPSAHAQDALPPPAPVTPAAEPAVSEREPAPEPPAAPLMPSEVAPPAPRPATVVVEPAPAPAVPAAPPPAPAWSPVFTGSYFTRYEFRANYDDMGVSRARFLEGDAVFYRLRFGIGTGPISVGERLKVALQFTPQAAGVFGALGPNTVVDAALGLHEGFARLQGDMVRFDAGRFELNYGDALIIGNLDWNELGRSFDGVRTRLAASPTSAWFDLFATMVDEGRDPSLGAASRGFGDGDTYFYGAYAGLGPAITQGLELDAYVLGRSWIEQKGLRVDAANPPTSPLYERESAHEVTVGARAKQKLGVVDYRFEGGVQAGSRPGAAPTLVMGVASGSEQKAVDVLAYHADLELGLNLLSDRLRVGVEGMYASGDDPSSSGENEGWDELYPTAHKWLGLADVFTQGPIKRTNVASGVLHLMAKATTNLTFVVDGHLFARPEKVGSATGPNGFAGGEVDLAAAYTLGKGLKVRALYAVFVPTSEFYPVAPATGEADPVHFGEVELRYDLMP